MLVDQKAIRILIVGAGRGGSRLLELLTHVRGVEIAGIVDRNPDAPGLRRAMDLDIPVSSQIDDVVGTSAVNLIVDVTGDPAMEAYLAHRKAPGTEILSGTAVRFLWQLVQHESQLQAEVSHADKLAAIGSFAAGIAHDINNPLYLILGLAEDLITQTDRAIINEHAQDIIAAVKRTSRICTDLTRYARRAPDEPSTGIELHGILEEALKIARYALLFQDMSVVRVFDAGRSTVRGNRDDLLHLFVNLITNAIHAMDGNGTLTLTTRHRERMVEVSVSDTGSGIPPALRDKVFEPFFTTKEAGKGTGLGLYNAKTIVEKMDGDIALESEVGKGTTFFVRLPLGG